MEIKLTEAVVNLMSCDAQL